jgi:hypothetical protein
MPRFEIDRQEVHPTFVRTETCPNPTTDLALFHLTKQVAVTPIPLPQATDPAPLKGTACAVVGYGLHLANSVGVDQLKRSAMSIIEQADDSGIDVSFGTGIADNGDSGGPLLCGGAAVGIVSCHSDGAGTAHRQEHYVAVSGALDWIHKTIASWNAPPSP